jgi:hypothetical protein
VLSLTGPAVMAVSLKVRSGRLDDPDLQHAAPTFLKGGKAVYSSRLASCLFDGLNTRRTRDGVEPDLGLFECQLQDQE